MYNTFKYFKYAKLLKQMCASCRLVHTWFLDISFVWDVGMSASECSITADVKSTCNNQSQSLKYEGSANYYRVSLPPIH